MMKALIYTEFQQKPLVTSVDDPDCPPDAVIIRVTATGLCRSDWHGWMGHDSMIQLPHIPGHEFAGRIAEVGQDVTQFQMDERVTCPFVCGCGSCTICQEGNLHVCPTQTQPGFTHWGSFAEYVVIRNADANLVRIPESMSDVAAASLGCRFGTAFHATIDQARLTTEEWIVIFGSGGVGLSVLLLAQSVGARTIVVDRQEESLQLARELGADVTLNASLGADLPDAIREKTSGGAHVTVDAIGQNEVCRQSLESLRPKGRHVQVGLLCDDPQLPIGTLIARELEFLGSHGIAAHRYPALFRRVVDHNIPLEKLVGGCISLSEAVEQLPAMSHQSPLGMLIIDRFE